MPKDDEGVSRSVPLHPSLLLLLLSSIQKSKRERNEYSTWYHGDIIINWRDHSYVSSCSTYSTVY